MKNLDTTVAIDKIRTFFGRFHVIIFFSLVIVMLSAAVYVITNIATHGSQLPVTSNDGISTAFDQETISRIKTLNTTNGESFLLPQDQRINPFRNSTSKDDICTSTIWVTNPAAAKNTCVGYRDYSYLQPAIAQEADTLEQDKEEE